ALKMADGLKRALSMAQKKKGNASQEDFVSLVNDVVQELQEVKDELRTLVADVKKQLSSTVEELNKKVSDGFSSSQSARAAVVEEAKDFTNQRHYELREEINTITSVSQQIRQDFDGFRSHTEVTHSSQTSAHESLDKCLAELRSELTASAAVRWVET
ncbi:unnamed protein product, partial [Polarella glacialis]